MDSPESTPGGLPVRPLKLRQAPLGWVFGHWLAWHGPNTDGIGRLTYTTTRFCVAQRKLSSCSMPVIVETPAQGEAFGPGMFIRASTQSVLPVGHHWDALLFQPGTQDTLIDAISFVEGQSVEMIAGVRQVQPGQREPIFSPQLAQPATGGEYELHVRVISAQSTILDTSGPIGVVWKPDPWGTAYVQSLAATSTVQGGFTETDRTTINASLTAVTSALPLTTSLPGVANVGLEQLQKGPPVDFLSEGENLLLTGRSSITRASGGTGVYAYGGRWSIESAPPGLGKLDGQAVLYEQRIAQFLVIKNRLGGGQYASDLVDSHYDNGELTWPVPVPVRIDFDILPGVTVRWRWLLFLGQ